MCVFATIALEIAKWVHWVLKSSKQSAIQQLQKLTHGIILNSHTQTNTHTLMYFAVTTELSPEKLSPTAQNIMLRLV